MVVMIVYIMKGYIFLYLLIYFYLRKMGNYGNRIRFQFLNIDISLTNKVINLEFAMYVLKYLLEEKMSQIVCLCPSFYFFETLISTLSQIKPMTYINILRHTLPSIWIV